MDIVQHAELISSGTPSSQFWYGPDRERIKQVGNYASGTETTFYVGGILEKVVSSGVTRYRHRIEGPSGLIASYERPTSGPEETFYFTKDHLGSVDTITDQGGAVEARLSHDAFGARRDESDWHGAPPSTPWSGISRRGYTEHEHLDNLGLVHMNGRVQDPAIGRFLSADPNVPDPLSGQSFNRYSYVVNNPLTLIDPTGFDYWPSQREDATYNGNSVGLNDWLWVSNSIGPDVFEPQSNEEIGFYRPNTSSPNPVVEEPGPDKSSVPCDLGPCSTANPDQSPDIIQVGIDCISVGSSEVVSRANATCTGAASVRRYYSTGPGENAARAGEILLQDPNLTRGQKFAVVGAVVLAGAGSLYAAGAATVTVVGSGNTAVYLGYDAAGRIVYVGITNNIARRALEHAGRFTIGGLRGAGNLLRTEAKAVEQVLINRFGLSHQGGQLLNRINSIARSNPNYQQAIQVGTRILQELGL